MSRSPGTEGPLKQGSKGFGLEVCLGVAGVLNATTGLLSRLLLRPSAVSVGVLAPRSNKREDLHRAMRRLFRGYKNQSTLLEINAPRL